MPAPRTAAERRRLRILVVAFGVLLLGTITLSVVRSGDDDPTSSRPGTSRSSTTTASTTVDRSTESSISPPSSVDAGHPCDPATAIAALPIRRRLAQVLFVGVDPSSRSSLDAAVAEEVGGIFVGGNDMTLFRSGALRDLATRQTPPFVAVDDEGGRVQRIDALVGDLPSAREVARANTPEEAQKLAEQRGHELRELGVTMDFAPVVDVSSQSDQEVIGDRSYSSDPAVVTTYARAFLAGLDAAGVRGVLKHFPGHGRADGDTHKRAATTPPLPDLEKVDLAPYANLLGSKNVSVMVGGLDVPGLTAPGLPASLSPAVVDGLLRGQMGFRGLVITDDISGMKAITSRHDVVDAIRLSIHAGVDMPLLAGTPDVDHVLDELERQVASGELETAKLDISVGRVLAAKGLSPCS